MTRREHHVVTRKHSVQSRFDGFVFCENGDFDPLQELPDRLPFAPLPFGECARIDSDLAGELLLSEELSDGSPSVGP